MLLQIETAQSFERLQFIGEMIATDRADEVEYAVRHRNVLAAAWARRRNVLKAQRPEVEELRGTNPPVTKAALK